jgi:ribosomal-protein-alanine N-acetyltransferase
MTEAVRAVVACAGDFFRLERLEAKSMPENIASERVLQKSGFEFEGMLEPRPFFKGGHQEFKLFGRVTGFGRDETPEDEPLGLVNNGGAARIVKLR